MADLRKVANKINEAKPPNMGTGVSNPSFLPEIKKERGKKEEVFNRFISTGKLI